MAVLSVSLSVMLGAISADTGHFAPAPIFELTLANVKVRISFGRLMLFRMRPQGRFAVVNWEQRPREETQILEEPRGPKTQLRLSSEQTVQSIQAAGLSLVAIIEIPPYYYGAVFKA